MRHNKTGSPIKDIGDASRVVCRWYFSLSPGGRGDFLSVIPDPDRGSSVFVFCPSPSPLVGEGWGEGEKKSGTPLAPLIRGERSSAVPLIRGNEPVLSLSKEGLSDKEDKRHWIPPGNHSPLEGESQKPSRQASAEAVGGSGAPAPLAPSPSPSSSPIKGEETLATPSPLVGEGSIRLFSYQSPMQACGLHTKR